MLAVAGLPRELRSMPGIELLPPNQVMLRGFLPRRPRGVRSLPGGVQGL